MHVAAERDHDFGLVEDARRRRDRRGLAEVELRLSSARVNVVQRRIAVGDVERLPDLHAEDMRDVAAAFLIEHHAVLSVGAYVRAPRPSFT